MGSDDLFHKRKARNENDNARRKSFRQPYDRVLIVCEGEKTEPYYFEEVKSILELDSANIEIDGSCGSSPINVFNHAALVFSNDRKTGEIYNRVFCVFDRDSHTSYAETLKKIDTLNTQLVKDKVISADELIFTAIKSVPSFEYWFLLHYIPTTKPYEKTGAKSVGDLVIEDLRVYMPSYKKTQKGIFEMSIKEGLLDGAKAHSKRIFEAAKVSSEFNPSTNVHELIDYLQNLKG